MGCIVSLSVFMHLYNVQWIFMGLMGLYASNGSLWVLIGPYSSIWILLGLYISLFVLMDSIMF